MRRLFVLATAATVTAAASVALAMPASADLDGTEDLSALTGTGRVIRSESCGYVEVTANLNMRPGEVHLMETGVWLRGRKVGDDIKWNQVASERWRGSFHHCPLLHGVGTFRVGPTTITTLDEDFVAHSFVDESLAYVDVKQAARVRAFTASRSGSKVTFKARPTFYAAGSGWRPMKRQQSARWGAGSKAFHLQRRPVNRPGAWRTIRRAKSPKGKVVTFTAKAKRTFRYRIVSPETSRTFSARSATLLR